MKSPSGAFLAFGGDGGLQVAGAAIALEEHHHYCSTCRSYWDHADGLCANRGYTMICMKCAQELLGVHAQVTSGPVTVQARDWSKNTEALMVQKQ
jgi:hypothetical protein